MRSLNLDFGHFLPYIIKVYNGLDYITKSESRSSRMAFLAVQKPSRECL